MKIKAAMFALALLSAGVTVASAQDPNLGTWKLNEAKSHFGKGATKNHTVVYEAAGDETKVTVGELVDAVSEAGYEASEAA